MDSSAFNPKDVIGLTNLILEDEDVDVRNIENEILNGNSAQEHDVNMVEQFKEELDELSKAFDLDLQNDGSGGDLAHVSGAAEYSTDEGSPRFHQPSYNWQEPDTNSKHSTPPPPRTYSPAPKAVRPPSPVRYHTKEEQRQNFVDTIIGEYDDDDTKFDLGNEYENDDKNQILENIETLRSILIMDSVDLSNIPLVNANSSMADIRQVHKILVLKNQRNRYCTIADDVILMMVYGLESVFDGKKEYFGRKPNLSGWNTTVKMKLRRMRYETSTLVREVMQSYHISPWMRIGIEFIPSMIAYSAERQQSQRDNLATEQDFRDKLSSLDTI